MEWNPAAEWTFGYPASEATGQEIAALIIPPALREAHRQGMARYLASGEGPVLGKRIEITAMRFGGEEFPIEMAITPVPIEGQTLFTAYLRDISERKASEAALRQAQEELEARVAARTAELSEANQALQCEMAERRRAEENYRSLFENAVEGIFQSSPEGRYLSANPALARLYGYASREEMIGGLGDIQTRLYVNPRRRAEFIRLMAQHGSVSGFESEVRRKDGTTLWISETARSIHDDRGTLLRYEGTVEDITERRRVEEEIRAANDMRRLIMDNIPQFIFWKDRNSVYLGCNENFARGAGLNAAEEIVGKTDYDLPWKKEEADGYRRDDRRVMEGEHAGTASSGNPASGRWPGHLGGNQQGSPA